MIEYRWWKQITTRIRSKVNLGGKLKRVCDLKVSGVIAVNTVVIELTLIEPRLRY